MTVEFEGIAFHPCSVHDEPQHTLAPAKLCWTREDLRRLHIITGMLLCTDLAPEPAECPCFDAGREAGQEKP
jgi:hypothetical protein